MLKRNSLSNFGNQDGHLKMVISPEAQSFIEREGITHLVLLAEKGIRYGERKMIPRVCSLTEFPKSALSEEIKEELGLEGEFLIKSHVNMGVNEDLAAIFCAKGFLENFRMRVPNDLLKLDTDGLAKTRLILKNVE